MNMTKLSFFQYLREKFRENPLTFAVAFYSHSEPEPEDVPLGDAGQENTTDAASAEAN
jgi:hypothetical protein